MARTLADELVAEVLGSLHTYLKPLGFKKSGSTFRRETEEASQFVNLQRNSASTKDAATVTVNIGFELKGVRLWFRKERKVTSVWSCDWHQRIGHYIPGSQGDKWWTMTDAATAHLASSEILVVLPTALAELYEFSTEAGAARALKMGMLAGATIGELREYVNREPGSDHWHGFDMPFHGQ